MKAPGLALRFALAAALGAAPTAVAQHAHSPDQAASAPVVIDGSFDDWRSVPIAVADGFDAPRGELDLGEVRVGDDEAFVHLLVYLGRTVNVQRLDGHLRLLLDADGSPATGPAALGLDGVDAIVTFTPTKPEDPSRPGMGVGVTAYDASGEIDLSPYDVGLTFAPTYASRQIEIRIERGAAGGANPIPGFLTGARFSGKLVLTDAAGSIVDETDPFTHVMTHAASAPPPAPAANVDLPAAAPGTDLRVMSWNTEFGGLVKEPDAARRVIRAVAPDVVLFQEMTDESSAAEIEGVLNGSGAPGDAGAWKVLFGSGGGNLRCAVATRLPMVPAPGVEPLPYPHSTGRYVRTAAAAVEANGRRLLVVSTHLKCCGRIGDSSDQKRELEADAIRAAVLRATDGDDYDGVVIGGDMNLVGGHRPLEILGDGLDLDRSDLGVAGPMQLDGRSNATWSDDGQPFVAGRLDYVLLSDSALEPLRSFVLDAADLGPAALRRAGLQVGDVSAVSDHMPVVVDLRWLPPTTPTPATPSARAGDAGAPAGERRSAGARP